MSKRFGTPRSMAEVNRLFSEIAEAQKKQGRRIKQYNQRLRSMKEQSEKVVRAFDKEIKHRRTNIFLYYLQYWKELTKNGKKRIITLLSGNKFGTYWVQSGVEVLNSKRAIMALEARGLQRLIRKEIDKRAVLREREAVSGIKDIRIGERKMFKVLPKDTGIAVTEKLHKLKKTVK